MIEKLQSLSIVGGGRWAKTIAGVAATLLKPETRIVIHSPRNERGVAAWICECSLGDRMVSASSGPDFGRTPPGAVIVANETAAHLAAAAAALGAQVPVLVEKPMAIGRRNVDALCALAHEKRTTLAASHVFLFTRYLDRFAELVGHHRLLRLSCTWSDGRADVVRGQAKSYDSLVSVFDDLLPHVVPIVHRLTRAQPSLTSLEVRRGGAEVLLKTWSAGVDVTVELARNAERRRRMLVADTDDGSYVLDFSDEPGTITGPQALRENGDPLWDTAPRPLASMLSAFFAAADGFELDPRLSPEEAALSAAFANRVRPRYREHQTAWLEQRAGNRSDADLDYALKEKVLFEAWKAVET